MIKTPLLMQETWDQSLGLGGPLEKDMAIHFSILAWRIPWTEEPGGLPSMGSQELDMTSDQTTQTPLLHTEGNAALATERTLWKGE